VILFDWRSLFKVNIFTTLGEEDDMAGSLEARLGHLEELLIIIVIIIIGGRGGHWPPVGDSVTADTSRMEALMRLVRPPRGDPFASDVTRMPLEAVEARLLEVNAELTRLRSHEAELNTRLKDLRGNKIK
jgi:hypothetical protein